MVKTQFAQKAQLVAALKQQLGTNEVAEEVAKLNNRCVELIGKNVAYFVEKYGRILITLRYGDKEYTFNPDGYNMLYVVKTLYNNPVMDAVME